VINHKFNGNFKSHLILEGHKSDMSMTSRITLFYLVNSMGIE